MPEKNPGTLAFKWLVSLGLPLCVYFLTPLADASVTRPMAMFLAVTLWAVCMWCMNVMSEVAVGLVLPVLYVVLCGVRQQVVLSPWLSDVPAVVIGGFALGKILDETGLGKRIGLWCVRTMGGTLAGTLAGVGIAVAIVAPFVPAIMGKAALFCAIGTSLCDALGFKPKSREATAVVLAFCLAVASTKLCYLTGGGDLVLGVSLLEKTSGHSIGWMEYARHNFLPGMLYAAMSLALVMLLLPAKVDRAKLRAAVRANYDAMGPVTAEQKRAAMLLCATLLLLVTDSTHGISAGITLLAITFAAFLPGVRLLTRERFAAINFAPLFFIMGCMTIGSAGGFLKVTGWIADKTLPYLNGLGENAAAMASYGLGVAVNFLLTPLAATTTLTPPLVDLGMKMHLDPRILFYSFQYGLDNYVFPYEYAVLLYFFSTGYMLFSDMARVLLARMALTAVFLLCIAIPFWKMML